uniref:Uncharacterized protein n=1 Tax=Lactuca sativa TaxID=4236 RepID=A0A9R1W244_LACSA|nr:hypothetical protein LSAT_V11C400195390 [Lactuca sativa]
MWNKCTQVSGRTSTSILDLCQCDVFETGYIDEWLEYAPIFSLGSEYEGACKYVDGYMLHRTFLVGHILSVAVLISGLVRDRKA